MPYERGGFWNNKPPLGTLIDCAHPLAQGLVAAYVLNEGAGATYFDAFCNRFNGSNGTAGPTWSSGQRGPVLKFASASSQFLTLAASNKMYPTVPVGGGFFCRFSPASVATKQDIVSFNASGGNAVGLGTTTAAKGSLLFRTASATTSINGTTTLVAGNWYTLGGYILNSDCRLYVNGIQEATGSTSTLAQSFAANGSNLCRLGADANTTPGNFFNGSLELAYWWKVPLAPADFEALHLDPYTFFQAPNQRRWLTLSSTPPVTVCPAALLAHL